MTTTDTAATDPVLVCQAWQPIWWSSKDTNQTIEQAKNNNIGRKAWGCDG